MDSLVLQIERARLLLDLIVSFTNPEKDFIVASLFLYFGNDILPLINNETSFSKGTYKGDIETYRRTKIE